MGQRFPGAARAPRLGPAEAEFLAAYAAAGRAVPDYPAVQAAAGAVPAVHCVRQAGGSARDLLWDAALALDTPTVFGGFRNRPGDGVQAGHQAGHQTVLVRWTAEGLVPARAGYPGAAPA